ncbi:TPA: DUF551 domain-containing protein [Enterobacter hormaechei subsp. xiangfangensis]
MNDSLNNKELVAAGHEFAKTLSSDTAIIDIAKMVSRLAERLDCTTAALRETNKQRDALASRNAEPIILYRERNPYNGMATGWEELNAQEYDFVKDNASDNAEFRTVYTAPPAPVVPKEVSRCLGFFASVIKSGEPWTATCQREYDAACAAMLQGKAEPVSQRDELPEGWVACSERMPEESGRYWCYVEEINDLGKSHYQWNCSWNGDRWWVESDNGGRVTHWMPLPAAPQQEVK